MTFKKSAVGPLHGLAASLLLFIPQPVPTMRKYDTEAEETKNNKKSRYWKTH